MESGILRGKHMVLMLAAICATAFMDGLDGSIVSIVLPDIGM